MSVGARAGIAIGGGVLAFVAAGALIGAYAGIEVDEEVITGSAGALLGAGMTSLVLVGTAVLFGVLWAVMGWVLDS